MSPTLLIGVAAGLLLGNPKMRTDALNLVKQITGKGIDALNSMGGVTPQGEPNVTPPPE